MRNFPLPRFIACLSWLNSGCGCLNSDLFDLNDVYDFGIHYIIAIRFVTKINVQANSIRVQKTWHNYDQARIQIL